MKVTIEEIEEDLCDLDTEYREALAKGLVDMKYLSDTPLSLKYGTDMQQQELKRVYSKPLSGKQLKDIINYISKDMQGDYQYGRYKGIASMYLNIADQIMADKNKGREARETGRKNKSRDKRFYRKYFLWFIIKAIYLFNMSLYSCCYCIFCIKTILWNRNIIMVVHLMCSSFCCNRFFEI